MRTRDPQMWAAQQLHRCIDHANARPDRRAESDYESILFQAGVFERSLMLARRATSKRWLAAGRMVQARAAAALRQLHYAAGEALQSVPPTSSLPTPTLRAVLDEVRQLGEEFPRLVIEPQRGMIGVVTEPVELQGVYLGAFRLELLLDRLSDRPDVSAIDVIALDPHPAAASDDTTHPHVRDNQLCAGDATVPIAAALREGRICDAFLAFNAVLNHYNPASPYVSLDDWKGTPCADCGRLTGEDRRYFCDDCDNNYCDECFSVCDVCDVSCCRGCLEQDNESGRRCCRRCRHRCGACRRTVDADSFVEERGLCPGCDEERQQREEQEQQTTQQENNDDEHEPADDPTDPGQREVLDGAVTARSCERAE